MLSSYNFSLKGRVHEKYDIPCQDFSIIESVSPSWCIAAVADGVGSCAHSEIASEIAVREAVSLVKRLFPGECAGQSDDYLCVIRAAFHGAANAIEDYVARYDPGNEAQYQTTLALAIMSPRDLYYANAGDSGIIALSEEDGRYHVLTHKGNDESGCVYSLPAWRFIEAGKAAFTPAAVMCLTDGILDALAPRILSGKSFNVNVPFANLFCTYGFSPEINENEAAAQAEARIRKYLRSDECSGMGDDLSAAVIVNTGSLLRKEDIPWQEPEIDYYTLKLQELGYMNEVSRRKMFLNYIKERNPSFSEQEAEAFSLRYIPANGALKGTGTEKPEPVIYREGSDTEGDKYFSQPEEKPDSNSEEKAVSKPEAGPVSNPEVRAVSKPEAGPVSNPEASAVLKPEVRIISKPEEKPVSKLKEELLKDGRKISPSYGGEEISSVKEAFAAGKKEAALGEIKMIFCRQKRRQHKEK